MSRSSATPRDNLTLSEADLAACRPIVGEGGHVLRALCPFHGPSRQRSLRVQVHSGRFVCFACGAWGYMETARAQWREEQQRQAVFPRPPTRRQRAQQQRPAAAVSQAAAHPPAPRAPAPARPDLGQQLIAFQAALPGSRGDTYLQQRGIPLALAQQLGVGYAAPGTWPHPPRDWRGGRVVFPHTTPDGRLVNLYGRAVGTAEQVPKAKRHDHLPGAKGYFNAAALQPGAGPLWVCEGAFDALALLAAGVPRVVAICGVQGWAWMRVQTSAKSWPITAAGSTSSRLVMAWGLTCSGATPNKPSRAKTLCISAMDGTRRHTKLTMMAIITGRVRIRCRMRMSRCGWCGSRRSSWRGASSDGLSTSISRCSTSSTAGRGICERCRKSAWDRCRDCLRAMGCLLSRGFPA